ncbi:IclR family transcriptional regulator domain-containing protein [Paracandidimonas soli]|uniref:IclR family transcriptional regulator n=1 Tax=Paracandidimonas soli TaxID=1917182 RepID=A0A4R3VGQ1_9BURK|nr:IclR family transcriptional regulator C-terminal domain-containing protein [Paracandidimonas soli]TCV02889.1 IclR family transcriptional regulator [Paracandidimonas soli]
MATTSGEGTGALEKALDVLDAIGASPDGLGQSELAAQLALPRTTVYRLLATLVTRGFVRRDPLRKVYCLGFRCFEMARQSYAQPDLVAAALMELRLLRDLTGETSYLAVLDGREVISLERCDGAHSLRSAAAMGERKPVYCTSQGKAILSAMPDAVREELVRDIVLKPLTEHTIVDRRRLNAELRITRSRGYAIDDEEIVLGVRCVGAPVVDSAGQVRGAISVAGPAYRLTRERLELLGPEVAEAARRVGAQLPPVGGELSTSTEAAIAAVPGNWAFHGAYPTWTPAGDKLWWADALAPSVRMFENGQDREVARLESPVLGLVRDGDDVIAVHAEGALRIGEDGSAQTLDPWRIRNVLAVCNGDADAVWIAAELPESGTAIGMLREDGSLDVRWRIGELVQSLGWHAQGQKLYATVPESGSVLILQPGQSAVRRLVTLPLGSGRVSGLAFDAQGGVWTTLCDGWAVVRIGVDGQVDRLVGLPVPCATDLAFRAEGGASGMGQLAITTGRHSVSLDALSSAPLSGRLLLLDL